MELITIIILFLLAAGVVGSLLPMAPGALLSLGGMIIYIVFSDDPSLVFASLGVLTAGFALMVDWFAGAAAAKYGGASNKTSMAAGIAGLIGFLIGGPIGIILLVSATVFVREYLIHSNERDSMKAAVYTTIGMLGSGIVQAMLTGSILIAYIILLVFF